MADFIALLGVKGGPAIRPGSNRPTSTLLSLGGRTILVDAGLGAALGVCAQSVALTDLDAIFVTHLHSDHYLELGPLIHTAWTAGLRRKLPVFGPPGLDRYWTAFLASMEYDIRLRIADEGRIDLASLVEIHVLDEDEATDIHGITVSAMLNVHPPIEQSFALRFETDETVIVLSGDTAYMPEMAVFAQGADVLVHEAMLIEGVERVVEMTRNGDDRLRQHILRSHTAAHDVGRVAKDAAVRRLVLNHFVPDGLPEFTEADWREATRETYGGDLVIGRDGMRLELG